MHATDRDAKTGGALWKLAVAIAVILATIGAAFLIARPVQPLHISVKAHGGRPLRVLIVGDSLAGTLEVGLVKLASEANIQIVNATTAGCSAAIAWNGAWTSDIWTPTPPGPPCQSAAQLSEYWRQYLVQVHPDVVFYASHMDIVDQEAIAGSNSKMTGVLDPDFAAKLQSNLTQAVQVLGSTGATVVLGNAVPTLANLTGNAGDNPQRLVIYNRIIAEIASQSAGRVVVFDLTDFFSKPGTENFSLTSPEGIQWRCEDGIHFAAAAGQILAPSLFATFHKVAPAAVSSIRPHLAPDEINQPWPVYAEGRAAMRCPLS